MTVQIEYQQDTVDTGEPCYKVKKNQSYLYLVDSDKTGRLMISHAMSDNKGDFSDMMDAVTDKLDKTKVTFTMVINNNLKSVLEGFEEEKKYWDKLGEEMTVLKGEWENDK